MKIAKKFKKSENGSITLMVLMAMIFMLAVITSSYLAISNESIGQNRKVSQITKQYQVTEEDIVQEYGEVFDNIEKLTIDQVRSNDMLNRTINTVTSDTYGNKIVIPAGFKVTDDAIDVTQGIVIEDKEGNQFVWVPIGDIYTDVERTEENKKTITLGRYDFAEDGTASDYSGNDTEDTAEEHNSEYGNAIAKDIEEFKTSANNNSGYYIGRYEAGLLEGTLDITDMTNDFTAPGDNWTGWIKEDGTDVQMVCKQEQQVWNYVTQNKASELSRNMYASDKFTSDLINSYAWDTAIVFIQTFGKENNSKLYAYQSGFSIDTTKASTTGTGILIDTNTVDKQCNIFDMAGNVYEWTTETSRNSICPCICRGGIFDTNTNYTSYSRSLEVTLAQDRRSFRPLLYL